jgi:DNA-binding CsgD family transcriptional regulator
MQLWKQMEEMGERTRVASISLSIAQRDATLALVDGRLEDAVELVERFVECADEAGASVRGRQLGAWMLLAPTQYLAHADAWLAAYDDYASRATPSPQASLFLTLIAARAICLAQLGGMDEARALADPVLDEVERGKSEDELPIQALVILLQASVVLEHRAAARAIAARLECVAHLAIADFFYYTCIARHLGDAALMVGDRAAARVYYAQALEVAGKIRFRPELALAHLRLAELQLLQQDKDVRSQALEHLNIAIPELRDMHMQPALERALALRETLAPAPAQSPARESASDTLTAREREIARLTADGRSNREIADTLVITEGTVEVHVKHILSKLGFRSRTQVATWFADQHSGKRAVDRP